jgi:hypothetical protein
MSHLGAAFGPVVSADVLVGWLDWSSVRQSAHGLLTRRLRTINTSAPAAVVVVIAGNAVHALFVGNPSGSATTTLRIDHHRRISHPAHD